MVMSVSLVLGVVTSQDFGTEVVDYLTQFGYLLTSDAGAESFVDVANVVDAVEKFNQLQGLTHLVSLIMTL